MNIVSVKNYLEGQIKAHKNIISVLEEVKSFEGLKAFDGKVINKRIKDCFYECKMSLKTPVSYLRFECYPYKPNTYTLEFNTYKPSGETYSYLITHDCTVYGIPVVNLKRFDYAGFIVCLDKSLDIYKADLKQLEYELEIVGDVVADFNKIIDDINKFNKKYSYYVRQGAKFSY